MSAHDSDSITHEVKKGVLDARDSAAEAVHHVAAEGEAENRRENGDTMTAGEKLDSVGREADHRLHEGADKVKKSVRDAT